MAFQLRFSARALREIGEAQTWYEQQSAGLGAEFIAAMELQLKRLEQTPLLYAEVIPMYTESYFRVSLMVCFMSFEAISSRYWRCYTTRAVRDVGLKMASKPLHRPVRGECFPFTPSIRRVARGTQGERKMKFRACGQMYRTNFGIVQRFAKIFLQ